MSEGGSVLEAGDFGDEVLALSKNGGRWLGGGAATTLITHNRPLLHEDGGRWLGGGAETTSWCEALDEVIARLQGVGIRNAQTQAQRLVAEVAGLSLAELPLHQQEPAESEALANLRQLVERRCLGEPLQYVLGRWGFRSLDLMVDDRALIPRPETEVVAGLAIDATKRIVARKGCAYVVDLGTGCGAIALSVATECRGARVFATDISRDALNLARTNAERLSLRAGVPNFCQGDWFAALPGKMQHKLDVVVSNPPYVAAADELPSEVEDWEPSLALRAGNDGLSHLEAIIAQAPNWLAPGGTIVLETAPNQTKKVSELLSAHSWKTEVHRDLSGRPRAVAAVAN